eukprot:Gb_16737 [translate_table: standard]
MKRNKLLLVTSTIFGQKFAYFWFWVRIEENETWVTSIIRAALPQILEKTTKGFYEQTLQVLSHTADITYNRIQKLDVLQGASKPQGSMFLMVKIITAGFKNIRDDIEFSAMLAKEESVIVLPGSPLGMKDWIRITFAISPSLLEEAWNRIESFCLRHSKTA